MAVIASSYSATSSVTFTTDAWLLTDEVDGTLYAGGVVGDPSAKRATNSQAIRVIGRNNDVVVSDAASGLALDLTFLSQTAADQASLVDLLTRQRALLVRSTPYPSTLMRVVGDVATDLTSLGARTLWRTKVSLTEVDA